MKPTVHSLTRESGGILHPPSGSRSACTVIETTIFSAVCLINRQHLVIYRACQFHCCPILIQSASGTLDASGELMSEKVNKHVSRLNRFLPFSAEHDQIYEEYQQSDDSLLIETSALRYLQRAVTEGARIVVLTGDAGHGKTYLCRRLIETHLGYSEDEARDLINTNCDGETSIPARDDRHQTPLRIFKDFSELQIEVAASRLEAALHDESVSIVCANEGRLRAVLKSEQAGAGCHDIFDRFEQSFRDGLASVDGRIHIINLNNQSVASDRSETSILSDAVRQWTSGTRWRVCDDCSSRSKCPIANNRSLLASSSSEQAAMRVSRTELLVRSLERVGAVITIRDTLMLIAYMITGGLTCADVHGRLKTRRKPWQAEYAFYNLLFEAPGGLSRERLRRLPTLAFLERTDPGLNAVRSIDERLVNEQGVFAEGQLDLCFPPIAGTDEPIDAAQGIDQVIANPRSRKERAQEADVIRTIVRSLRRRAFFDGLGEPGSEFARIGFRNGAEFVEICDEKLDKPSEIRLKNRLFAGFHHMQGVQKGESPTLFLVDPAFGRSSSEAAILADKIPGQRVQLLNLASTWTHTDQQKKWSIMESVDWLDRHIVLRVESSDHKASTDFHADLMMLDCLLRASSGHVPSKFYEHDLRKISAFLGKLAQSGSKLREITVLLDGKTQAINIDGGVIQVADA